MPQYPPEEIEEIKKCFALYIKFPKNRWKEIEKAEKNDKEGEKIYKELKEEYFKKYMPKPGADPHGGIEDFKNLDDSLFNENALQNLYFPAIDFENFQKFEKKYSNTFKEKPNQVSILAYDALGLIYYCWYNNNNQFKTDLLYNKNGFKGLNGEFFIKGSSSKHNLKIYKVHKKKFLKVY